MLNFLKPRLRIQRPNPIPLISFLIIQIYWMSLYSSGVFQIIGGIKAQIVILIIWFFTLFLFNEKSLKVALSKIEKHSQELILIVAFGFVHICNMIIGRGDMAYGYFVKSLLLVITYGTVIIYLKNDYQRYMRATIIVTLALGIIAVYVLPIIYAHPFIARFYGAQEGEIHWFGSWGFFMTYAIAMPCLIAVTYQQRGLLKIFLLVLCFVMVLMILFSTFAASIILLLMGFAGFILFSLRKKKTYFKIAFTVLMFIFIVRQYDLSQVPQLEPMGEKIVTIFTLGSASNYEDPNDPMVRGNLMKTSMKTFLENPLFGIGVYDAETFGVEYVGNHSGIVDSMAQFGLIGIIWYLIFILICFRRLFLALKYNPSNLIHQARFLTFILFLIGAMANPMLFDIGISAIVFILALSPIGLNIAHRNAITA